MAQLASASLPQRRLQAVRRSARILAVLLAATACGSIGIDEGASVSLEHAGSGGASSGGMASGGAERGTTGGAAGTGDGGANAGGTAGAISAAGSESGGTANTPNECDPADNACLELASNLIHRYSFDGYGTRVEDSVGAKAANITGAELTGRGALRLDGSEDYVTLPNGLLSGLPAVSLEIWFMWTGSAGAPWQRLFDFGSFASDGAEKPDSYLYVTVYAAEIDYLAGELTAGFSDGGGQDAESFLDTDEGVSVGSPTHIVLVADRPNARWALYKNGQRIQDEYAEYTLSVFDHGLGYLGRSLFPDPLFEGSIDEFRVYDGALTARAVELSFALGADASFPQP